MADLPRRRYPDGCLWDGLHALRASGRYAPLMPAWEWETRQDKMLAHALVTPPPILESRPEVPAALAAVLERMLAKSRRDRYATPADVARAVEPYTKGHDLSALLWTDRFFPPVSVIVEPGASDRNRGPETVPVSTKPAGSRPRWDRTQPLIFSKAIGVIAILSL